MFKYISILPILLLVNCQNPAKKQTQAQTIAIPDTVANSTIHAAVKPAKTITYNTSNIPIIPAVSARDIKLNAPLQTAFDLLGTCDSFGQGIACGPNITLFTNRYFFIKNNLVIVCVSETGDERKEKYKKAKITEIGIFNTGNASTSNGITLKQGSYSQIIKLYGKPHKLETNYSSHFLHYYSEGISFDCDKKSNKINKIAIYSKNKTPDFSY